MLPKWRFRSPGFPIPLSVPAAAAEDPADPAESAAGALIGRPAALENRPAAADEFRPAAPAADERPAALEVGSAAPAADERPAALEEQLAAPVELLIDLEVWLLLGCGALGFSFSSGSG